MQRNVKLLAICLLMVPMLTLVFAAPPAASKSTPMIVQPTMPWEQPNVYEKYGPRLSNIHYVFTGSPEESFNMLDTGAVDIIDWACSKEWKDAWEDPARTDIKVMGYGGEYGFYLLDTREDPAKPVAPPFSTQSYTLFGDPTTVDITLTGEDPYTCTRAAAARRAMAHLIDRTWIVSTVMGGLGEPIYIPSPAAHGGFNNPNVDKYYQDFDKARELLDDAGVVDEDDDGWRDIPGSGGEELILDFCIRLGIPRELAGQRIAADIEAELAIQVNEQYGGSDISFPHVMVNREMDLYTGGWIFVTFPDHYLDLYSSEGWYYPGFAPNYMKYCGPHPAGDDPHFDEEIDTLAKTIVTSLDTDEVKAACWAVQEKMMRKENVYAIGLVSTAGPKGWRTYMKDMPEEPGNEWKGIVNQTGQGVNNWFTYLNAHTDNMPDPSYGGTLTYGLSYSDIDFCNPIYSNWYQSWEIMGTVYDTLLILDPLDRVTMRPWAASSFIDTKEYDSVQGEEVSVLYFTIRKDVYFHDGVQLTADDVIFTDKYLVDKLVERGLPPPSWDSLVRDINRIDKIDDFHIKVWYEYPTYFAKINVGGNIILPEHIWKPIVDSGDPEAFDPDPNMIGSGPYQMDSSDYVAGTSADVYAYVPTSQGFFQYSAVQNVIVEGEPATPAPVQSTYWVGLSYIGAVKVAVKVDNYQLGASVDVTVTINLGAPSPQGGTVAADSWKGFKFAYPIGPATGPFAPYGISETQTFNEVTTWTAPPPPGVDPSTEIITFIVTADGDVISTGDPLPGSAGHVNMFDGRCVSANWGTAGPYTYPPADINWDSAVNYLDALVVMGNFGAVGY